MVVEETENQLSAYVLYRGNVKVAVEHLRKASALVGLRCKPC